MATVGAKGQITIPVGWRPILGAEPKATLYFKTREKRRVSIEKKYIQDSKPAKVLAKGSITIPQKIREYLNVSAGEQVDFQRDPKTGMTWIEKHYDTIPCPLCHGTRLHLNHECIVCNEHGHIKLTYWLYELESWLETCSRHGYSVTLKTANIDLMYNNAGEKSTLDHPYPQITLSQVSPAAERIHSVRLHEIQDFYQMRTLKDILQRLKNDLPIELEKEMLIDALAKLQNMFSTEPAKQEFTNWYVLTCWNAKSLISDDY